MKFSAPLSMKKLKLVFNFVSVGLLALCITFTSWVLLSYPVSIQVNNYLYSVKSSMINKTVKQMEGLTWALRAGDGSPLSVYSQSLRQQIFGIDEWQNSCFFRRLYFSQPNDITSLHSLAEVPKWRGFNHISGWYFKSRSVSIVRIWSAWLVNQTVSAFKDIPKGIPKVFLDIPHETLMEHAPKFDILVVSSGHWFTTKSVYVKKNEVVGGQLWDPPNGHKLPVNNVEAFRIALDTSITALAMHPNYTGVTILRSYSPDHYGGSAWNTGGSCMGKVEPARPDQLVENNFTNVMHEKQVTVFNQAVKKRTNGSKLRLMDITKAFSYRHDGHPGPYLSNDPIKRTTPGRKGHICPQDCVHWCTPGPIDTWNEFLLEIIRREFEAFP